MKEQAEKQFEQITIGQIREALKKSLS